MLLIFGFRTKAHRLGPVQATCRVCGHAGQLILDRQVTKFSVFFVPLIPIRTRYVLHCLNPACGAATTISADDARRIAAV